VGPRPRLAALSVCPRPVLVDGIDRIDIVSWDAMVLSIAAASAVAKVVRDRLMVQVGAVQGSHDPPYLPDRQASAKR
jgi:ribonuclease HII